MPDLKELRAEFAAAHKKIEVATRAHVAEEQRLRALQQEARAFPRRFDKNRQGDSDRREELEASVAAARRQAATLLEAKRAAVGDLARLTSLLEPYTDPRVAIDA